MWMCMESLKVLFWYGTLNDGEMLVNDKGRQSDLFFKDLNSP